MSGRMNWTKIEHERRLNYRPSPRAQSPTQKQVNYIGYLARRKGKLAPKPPKTKHGAGVIIDQLLELPDVEEQTAPKAAEVKPSPVSEMVAELREHFPQLTPMASNSVINLFTLIDPIGCAFTLDAIIREDAPEDRDELIIFLVRRFLEAFSDLRTDDTTVGQG